MADTGWMVRSEGGTLIPRFREGHVAVGWPKTGDLNALPSRDAIRERFESAYPDEPAGYGAGVLDRMRTGISVGDSVVTYDPGTRMYLVGQVRGEYAFDSHAVGEAHPHTRPVSWSGEVRRDDLAAATRSALGSTQALFSINAEATTELLAASRGEIIAPASATAAKEDIAAVKEDEAAKAFELVKDAIVALTDREMEHLAAAVLRAMGYRARVTPVGPDRNVDVIASPDGLGLKEPRIRVEVKHRPNTSMGPKEIRSFISILRPGDRGVFVSTGGFSKESRYEGERATHPTTLLDLDEFAGLIIDHYEAFDVEGRTLLPLVRVYLPTE